MINFDKFFLGQVGIIVKNEHEALEILEACEEEGIDIGDYTASDYKKRPYWYIEHYALNATGSYSRAIDHVRHVFTYQSYAFDNQI